MKRTNRLFLAFTLIASLASCMPFISTSPAVRQHIWVDSYWLGYVDGTVNSNKQLDVAVIYEGTEKKGSAYTLYLATEKGIRYSVDNHDDKQVADDPDRFAPHRRDLRETWYDLLDQDGNMILGVVDIYNDTKHGIIFFSTGRIDSDVPGMTGGLYYKKYTPDIMTLNSPDEAIRNSVLAKMKITKIESSGNYPLKAIDLTDTSFNKISPAHNSRTSDDIDGYAIDIQPVLLSDGTEKEVFFIATATGIYFSTDIFDSSGLRSDPNSATWGNIIGRTVTRLGSKGTDYPLATIDGAYREFNEVTGKMDIKIDDTFITGDAEWGVDDTNYDPIYNPIHDPVYNRNPDFYAWLDGTYANSQNEVEEKVKGQPITWDQYATEKGYTLAQNYNNLNNSDKAEQQQLRLYYENTLEIKDYGNPNNHESGIIRTYAYYRDKHLKATQIKGISVYDNTIYLATVGSGIAYCDLDLLLNPLNSNDPATFDDDLTWETYTHNNFHYPALLGAVNARSEENFWSVENIWGNCILANTNGIFYGADGGGIHQASTYKSIRTVRNVNGLAMDNSGHTQCILKKDSKFEYFSQSYYPALKNYLLKSVPTATADEIADLYYRPDKDPDDGITNENLLQGLRLNWKEYTTSGWSIYTAPGDIAPIQLPVLNFPSNQIRKIRFGNLESKNMIYIATTEGMGVAEVRKSYSTNESVKVPAEVTGDEQYSIDFVDWGTYNKDLSTLFEILFVRDIDVTKDENDSDYYIYCATYGQGLVRFHWKPYNQKPFNIDLEAIGL